MRKAAFTAIAPRNKFVLIAIGASPDEAADSKMWSLRDSFDGQELMWLSLGLEPTPELNEQFQNIGQGGETSTRLLEKKPSSGSTSLIGQKRLAYMV
ncbi:hypothetical protein SAMN04488005_0962 [Yoonia tamlensis]|uniref:Uncharacterized protein n=1 Tax=Yoonia tamlensis TaxID=390270 RepID=A0A1I6G2M5_9RHOB|nr:hypothetical protein SAMN04488005_0962 [Yoonia tamlensis]